MALTVGSIQAKLGINTNAYTRGLLNANALNEAFGSTFTNAVINPIAAGIALMKDLAGAFIRRSTDILASSEAYERLANATGVNVELLQALSAKFDQAGYSAAGFQSSITNFAKVLGQARLEGGESAKAFDQLGLVLSGNESVEEAFIAAIDAISQLPDAATKAAVAAQLFTRFGGAQMVDLFTNGADSVREYAAEMAGLGQVLGGETIHTLAESNTQIGRSKQLIDGIITVGIASFLEGLLPTIGLLNVDLSETGDTLIKKIGPAAEQLGRTTGNLVGDLSGIADSIERISSAIGPITRFLEVSIRATGSGATTLRGAGQLVSFPFDRDPRKLTSGLRNLGAPVRLGRDLFFEGLGEGGGGYVNTGAATR